MRSHVTGYMWKLAFWQVSQINEHNDDDDDDDDNNNSELCAVYIQLYLSLET